MGAFSLIVALLSPILGSIICGIALWTHLYETNEGSK